jgi:uncharacterized protein YlaI
MAYSNIEISPSSRALCQNCKRHIAKDEQRLVEKYNNGFNGMSQRYYCRSCMREILLKESKRINEMIGEIK